MLVVPTYPDERPDEMPGPSLLLMNADEALEDHLEHLTEKLDAVEKGIEERKEGVDNLLRRRLAELEEKNEDIHRNMNRTRGSSSEAWEEIKTVFIDLWAVLDRALPNSAAEKRISIRSDRGYCVRNPRFSLSRFSKIRGPIQECPDCWESIVILY